MINIPKPLEEDQYGDFFSRFYFHIFDLNDKMEEFRLK